MNFGGNIIFHGLFKSDDEDLESQKLDMDRIMQQYPDGFRFVLTSVDELEGSHGPFGYTPSNPIPANGPIGEAVYIFRLRTKDDVPFFYQRLGHMDSKEFSRKLDVYELLSMDGKHWMILYFSMYHLRRSTKCPDELHFTSWKKQAYPSSIFAKMGAFGASCPNEDFPFCLPRLVRANRSLLQLGTILAEKCAGSLEKKLMEAVPGPRPYDLEKLCSQHQIVNLVGKLFENDGEDGRIGDQVCRLVLNFLETSHGLTASALKELTGIDVPAGWSSLELFGRRNLTAATFTELFAFAYFEIDSMLFMGKISARAAIETSLSEAYSEIMQRQFGSDDTNKHYMMLDQRIQKYGSMLRSHKEKSDILETLGFYLEQTALLDDYFCDGDPLFMTDAFESLAGKAALNEFYCKTLAPFIKSIIEKNQ